LRLVPDKVFGLDFVDQSRRSYSRDPGHLPYGLKCGLASKISRSHPIT
jgi:hypothetical protein